ncbi:molecular chaperone [Telmatospirillum sp. J64-1]|uniref:TorD/DmsD family molecular chaperone n=1 Tax=Telmatospirillum sp. J64-1 TaxID=2502183 RepID=UPI00115C642E|nr:molecular chaperone TorD family protein [Telmatospirillum sp. J64-1]
MAAIPASDMIDEADLLRARLYTLLSRMLAKPPEAALLDYLASLPPDATPLGRALGALGQAARRMTPEQAEREFNALFIGVTRGEVVPYASYYLTGFLNDRPLARLRQDMQALGIERSEDVSEPEDHLAALCEMMAGLMTGLFGTPASLQTQQDFFRRHLQPWAGICFADLEKAPSANLYRPLGQIGRLFLEIETDAFAMGAAPHDKGGQEE